MSGVTHLVQTGPLILAAPIAAAAGAITFLSPCCLPLVPGYLSYVTGMSGTDAQRTEATGQAASATAAPAAGLAAAGGSVSVAAPAAGVATGGAAARPAAAAPCWARCCSCSVSRWCSPPKGWPSAASGWCCSGTQPG